MFKIKSFFITIIFLKIEDNRLYVVDSIKKINAYLCFFKKMIFLKNKYFVIKANFKKMISNDVGNY